MDDSILRHSESAPPPETACCDVLWTGGWDSTFRVLTLALVDKAIVRPHYIIDVARQSSLRELQAISEIRRELAGMNSDAAGRILPLTITSILDIPPEPAITASFERLRARSWLGGQYDWLARYAKSRRIDGLELSIHVDDKAYGFIKAHVAPADDGRGWIYRREGLSGDAGQDADLDIFAAFRFPLLDYTKLAMRETAIRHDFIQILENAWFCYQPIFGKPCGMCNPCIYAMEEGMGYRFPKSALLRYRLRHARKALDLSIRASRKAMRVLTAGKSAGARQPIMRPND